MEESAVSCKVCLYSRECTFLTPAWATEQDSVKKKKKKKSLREVGVLRRNFYMAQIHIANLFFYSKQIETPSVTMHFRGLRTWL